MKHRCSSFSYSRSCEGFFTLHEINIKKQNKTRASVLHKARISVDNCGDVYKWCDCGKEGEIVTSAARECVFDVFVLAFKEKHMRTVVTK